MPTYVIGHQNPDTDAVCSAIGYAALLRECGDTGVEAACCGEISPRTAFALAESGLPMPRLVLDVRPNAGQVCSRNVISAGTEDSIFTAINKLRGGDHRSLPVLAENGTVAGLLAVQRALDLVLPVPGETEQGRKVGTSLGRIVRVLSGEFQHEVHPEKEESFSITVAAYSAELFAKRIAAHDPIGLIVVAGDRPAIQLPSIELGIRAIVVTGGNRLSEGLLDLARRKNVTVIVSPHDTATTTLLINCSRRVTDAMSTKFVSFEEHTPLAELRARAAETIQPLFPVVDENGLLVGVISRSDLVNPQRTRLILVDHNELAQAVRGAEEAEILEVLDHHRVGGSLTSPEPIRFINEPVGSTSTLVAKEWRARGLTPPKGVALCLASGVISDTLKLTSPTTTDVDRDLLHWLAATAGVVLDDYAARFFSAGSALTVSKPSQAVRADCKDYAENGWKIVVGQVEEQGLDIFWQAKEPLAEALRELVHEKNADLGCLLVTDISNHHSLLLVEGVTELVDAIDYPRLAEGLFDLPGIVSRKKQLLPHLMRIMQGTSRRTA